MIAVINMNLKKFFILGASLSLNYVVGIVLAPHIGLFALIPAIFIGGWMGMVSADRD